MTNSISISEFYKNVIRNNRQKKSIKEISSFSPVYPFILENNFDFLNGDEPQPNYSVFYFSLWVSFTGKSDFSLISGLSETVLTSKIVGSIQSTDFFSAIILFEHSEDVQSFSKWLEYHRTWFSDDRFGKRPFPSLPSSGVFEISAVKDHDATEFGLINSQPFYSDIFYEKWIWILKNCHSPVYKTDTGFLFTNVSEAVSYKLVWKTEK